MPDVPRVRGEAAGWRRVIARDGVVEVRDTVLYVERRGRGRPVLLIHGAAEDAGLLRPQAESLAAAGFEVLSYDRRGTGHSGRDAWPGEGAVQHAGDAAALIRLFDVVPVVVGVGTGGIVALQLALTVPDLVAATLVWEAPAAGVVPDCAADVVRLQALTRDVLTRAPGDYCRAQTLLLTALHGLPVAADDPRFARARVNAEPMVRDDLTIALSELPRRIEGVPLTLAMSPEPRPCAAAAMPELAARSGLSIRRLSCSPEPYRTEPEVLTALIRAVVTAP